MIYVNENRVTGDKKVIKKEGEEKPMKTNKSTTENKAIILTSQPVTVQSGYVVPYEEQLTVQEKYCKENGFDIVEIINLPRFADKFAYWLKELKVKISRSHTTHLVIYSTDFFYMNFDLSMLYSAVEPYGVEVIDECEYMDPEEFEDIPEEPDAVLVTLLTDIGDIRKSADLVMCRFDLEMQKDILFTIANSQGYELDTMVFAAVNDTKTWDSFFAMLDTYVQVRNIENIIIRGDDAHKEFAKELIEYFINDEVNIMVSQPKLRIMVDSYDLCAPVQDYEEDEDDDLPFN